MKSNKANLDLVCIPSEDIVAREIEGEFIIVPLTSGIGDMENALYTINETGKAIWGHLDGKKSLKSIADELSAEFEAPSKEIQMDVLGFAKELLKKGILVESSKN